MNVLKHTFSILFLLASATNLCFAEVKLPAIVSSNMVLQRNTTITLWGWADPKEKITIKASWLSEEIKTSADKEGNWKIEVKTTNSKEAQTIRIKSTDSDITLDNVLFGEVWLCSGQSNMEQRMRGYYGQPTGGTQEVIAHANNKNLRLFNVSLEGDSVPRVDLGGHTPWQAATPASVKEFSAVAYFYGQQLQEILDVPVGMIHSSWGGSIVEAWMSAEVLSKFDTTHFSLSDEEGYDAQSASMLFNGMINPLIPYKIKGALWYQGESNINEPEMYKTLFPAMVKDWRTRWDIGDFPFYYVQIAPFDYLNQDWVANDINAPLIREAQLACLDLIPNSGMAVLMDIGEEMIIHPREKKKVADRLLYNALNKTYGYKSIDYSGPVYDKMEVMSDSIKVTFKEAKHGLYSERLANWEIKGFEIAGADKVFYPAYATNDWDAVYVRSEKVKKPVAVRYAWRSWVVGTLFDTQDLPASSFRTDNWDDAMRFEEP